MYDEEVTTERRYNRFEVIGSNGSTIVTTERKMTMGEVLDLFDEATAVEALS